jgi:regulator of sigma E protease
MIASNIATNFFAFVLVLGFLIFAHEAGHFLVAKLFRVRVLVFSFGFGQRLFGFRKGDTDYRVSLIPLGGYVRMAGDTPEEDRQGDPAEFLSKPKWQRFLILFAGPFMNLLIAVVFIAIFSMAGTESLVVRPMIGVVSPGRPAARAGLQPGDRIIAVNGERIDNWDDLRMAISLHAGTPLRIEYIRNGVAHTTVMTPERENSEYGPVGRAGIWPWIDAAVGRVRPNSPAARAGLRPGDVIAAANGRPITQLIQLDEVFNQAKGQPIELDVMRAGQRVHVVLPAVKSEMQDPYRGFLPPTEIRKLSLLPALKDSVEQNWKMLRYAFVTFGRLVRGEASVKEFSGPISIARISGEMLRRGWMELVALMAMISLQLGIINLFPIPVLDGGHIMILLVEGVVRRDLSIRVKERIQQIGFALLAALMIVVIYNDVITNVLLLKKG